MSDEFEFVERRQYDCDNESLFRLIEKINSYPEDTPEIREYYALRGFKFDAREIHDFCGITTYVTSWLFGINPNKRSEKSKSRYEIGILDYYKYKEGVDYVILKNSKKKGRADIPQREVLLTSRVVEFLLVTSKKTREEALKRVLTIDKYIMDYIRERNAKNDFDNLLIQ